MIDISRKFVQLVGDIYGRQTMISTVTTSIVATVTSAALAGAVARVVAAQGGAVQRTAPTGYFTTKAYKSQGLGAGQDGEDE